MVLHFILLGRQIVNRRNMLVLGFATLFSAMPALARQRAAARSTEAESIDISSRPIVFDLEDDEDVRVVEHASELAFDRLSRC